MSQNAKGARNSESDVTDAWLQPRSYGLLSIIGDPVSLFGYLFTHRAFIDVIV